MHILNVIQCANLGGMEQAAILRMGELIKKGHVCRLISLNPIQKLAVQCNRWTFPLQGWTIVLPGEYPISFRCGRISGNLPRTLL